MAWFGLKGEVALMPVDHYSPGNRQPLSCPLALLFGGEKRFENTVLDIPRNPSTAIVDPDLCAFGRQAGADTDLAQPFPALSRQFPYGMGAIDDDIEKDLAQLRGKTRYKG